MSPPNPDPARDPHADATLVPAAAPAAKSCGLSGPFPCDFGRYRVEEVIGRGGMGAVYRARDVRLGRLVALKVPTLSKSGAGALRERFLREAQSAAALSHPNICTIYEVGEVDEVPYLTMAYVDGTPLSRRINTPGTFEPRWAALLVRKVALALAAAHARGVIHRDIKPGNILITDRDEPIVIDFGLGRRDDAAHLTQEGEVLGTPAYMPPEQLAGDVRAMGPCSDIYSLGVVLYELLTGAPPFRGDLMELASQISLDVPAPPSRRRSGLDPALDAVCLKALAKRPADRWPSAKAFADALDLYLDGPTVSAAPILSLRVAGTPYAYRPLPGQDLISVGRQKRRPGDPPDHGNDFVLRVPGEDPLSLRISRRHFEVLRREARWFALDRSKAGTLLNDQPLSRDEPTALTSGDRLTVAGVLTLEVTLLSAPSAFTLRERRAVSNAADATGRVALEATMGDMVTMD
jgi:serine/threonine protein kinase